MLAFALVALAGGVAIAEETPPEEQPVFMVTTNGTTVTVQRTVDKENAQFTQSFPDGEVVRKLVLKQLGAMPSCFFPAEDSALPDGIDINNGQWRIRRVGALGTAPLKLGNSSSYVQLVNDLGGVMDITNKVIVANTRSQILATSTSHYFILRSLGVENGVASPVIGRSSGTSRITLALTEESNDSRSSSPCVRGITRLPSRRMARTARTVRWRLSTT